MMRNGAGLRNPALPGPSLAFRPQKGAESSAAAHWLCTPSRVLPGSISLQNSRLFWRIAGGINSLGPGR